MSARTAPSVLLDMRPAQGADAGRGIGSYASGLLGGLASIGFAGHLTLLLDTDLPDPHLPQGSFRAVRTRRRYRGRLAGYEEAAVGGQEVARIGPDVYHATSLRLPSGARCPVVVTLHDLIPWSWGGPAMRGERLRYWMGKRLLKRSRLVLAVSQATADDAVRLAGVDPGRVFVVYEAADPAYRPRADAAELVRRRWGIAAPYLLYVGALDARKDPRGLLEAWAAARASVPGLELVLAGDPGRQAPRDMRGARALGRVDRDELAALYSAAGCLVFPSRYEGFGLPCLEAMACGSPVAAYRNSSLPEVVGEAGALVPDGDAEALGRAAAAAVLDPEPWRRAGLERARLFTWDKTARQTVEAYESATRRLR